MQLVMDISDEDYEYLKKHNKHGLYTSILNSIPLPKGHGRIMDVDKVIKKMEEREEKLKDDRSIWETASVETALDMFGETIIEADNEGYEMTKQYMFGVDLEDTGYVAAQSMLNEIRAEIEGKYRVILKGTPKDDWVVIWNECIDEVLQIVDKYKESEK